MKKFIMPKGGQTTNESLITKWRKEVGDPVKLGDVLFEIETDKATLEMESFGEGFLLRRYFEEGEMVSTGSVVCIIGAKDEEIPDETVKAPESEPKPEPKAEPKPEVKPEVKIEKSVPAPKPAREIKNTDDFAVMATPAARFLAKELGIDIKKIFDFTGDVVKKEDVKSYVANLGVLAPKSAVSVAAAPFDPSQLKPWQTTEPLSTMRRTVAKRLTESVLTAPQYVVSVDIDMTNIIALRKSLNNNSSQKVSFNDIIIKCAARAIADHPYINGVFTDDAIIYNNDVNFGLAVGTDKGLLVPVVPAADKKTIGEIAAVNAENIKAVKEGRISPDMMSGGNITLSNLGMYDVSNFTAILNPPESCILAVSKIEEKCVVRDSQMVIKPMMNITATFDHRLIDGAYGAAFLKDLKVWLEEPVLLMLK